ncbi:MAG: FtsX-like permease family protein, partial [Candidatus Hodarchaeota archaeon]
MTVGQRFANTLGGQVQLKHWEPYLLRNMRIAGIFVRKPLDPLIGDTYSEDTLGDAIFISEKTLPREAIDKITKNGNLVTIRLFVRLSRMELAARGIGNLRMTIKDFKAQVEERNNWNVIIDSNTASLYALVGMFTVSRLLVSFLLLPAFVAAFLFIIFVSRLLFQDRREELALLGARGASVFQIFYGALMEMVLLASLGSILGIILSVGTVSLIAGTKAFLEVNFGWGLIWDILILMLFRPWLWILPPLICSAVLVFSVSYQINSYLQREDGVTRVASKRFRTWFVENSLDVVGLVGGYILLVGATLLGIIDSIAADASWLAALLLLILGLWIGFSLISTKVQTALSRPATRLLKPLLGSQSMFVLRSFQHRKSQILALGTIFVLAGSICFFSLSYQTTVQTHTEKVVTFTVGADLRLRVDGLNVTDLTTRLANIPAIDKATPIFESWGFIGERRIAVIGLVPELYAPIIADKISDPTIQYQWKNTLERLGNQSRQRGIIINTLIAQNYAVDIGEPFHLKIRQEYQRTFNIVGIFAAAPGFGLLSEDPQTYAGNNYGTV